MNTKKTSESGILIFRRLVLVEHHALILRAGSKGGTLYARSKRVNLGGLHTVAVYLSLDVHVDQFQEDHIRWKDDT